MREIKFRGWTENEGYIYQDHLDGYSIHELRMGCLCNRPGEGDQTKVILEQYTGLKDKNGREIYEGDILGPPVGLYVFWCEKCRGFQLNHPDINECFSCSGDARFDEYESAEIEVIGNIHENPEMLE